jgi:hypothetical protein
MSNKAQHTPEPWKIISDCRRSEDFGGYIQIGTDDCTWIAEAKGTHVGPLSKEEAMCNAQRIVDCVNACAGIEQFPLLGLKERLDTYALHTATLVNELGKAARAWKELAKANGEEGLLAEDAVYQDMLRAIKCASDFGREVSDFKLLEEKEVANG